jgi:hypothetical protein
MSVARLPREGPQSKGRLRSALEVGDVTLGSMWASGPVNQTVTGRWMGKGRCRSLLPLQQRGWEQVLGEEAGLVFAASWCGWLQGRGVQGGASAVCRRLCRRRPPCCQGTGSFLGPAILSLAI